MQQYEKLIKASSYVNGAHWKQISLFFAFFYFVFHVRNNPEGFLNKF